MNKREFKKDLHFVTMCAIQHNGWPCGTCFFSISDDLTNQDWQSVLWYRGDYKKEDLNNLPDKPMESIKKVNDILQRIFKS